MKPLYKKKRDFYKAEAERHERIAEYWKKEAEERNKQIQELTKPKVEDRIEVAWFCPTCRAVVKGTTIRGGNR